METDALDPESDRLTREKLLAVEPNQRQQVLESSLQTLLARRLWLDHPSRLDPQQPLSSLGLDSLMAIEAQHRLEAGLGVVLPLTSLLGEESLAQLATQVLTQLSPDEAVPTPPLAQPLPSLVPAPEQRHLPFPLNDIQQAYWVGRTRDFELGNVATHVYFEFESTALDIERLTRAWQRLISRHEMLRAIVLPDGRQQILSQVPPYQIEVVDLRGQDPQAVASQLEAVRQRMSHQVLPLDQWPLFELRAHRLPTPAYPPPTPPQEGRGEGRERIRLHLSFDLLIADAMSLFILLKEWFQRYQNPEAPLAPLEVSFRDYVLAEIALRDSERYQHALAYWRSRLETLPPAPELPLAKNPSAVTHPRFVRRSMRLEPETWQRLKTRATVAGLTPSGVLLAAFAEVLTAWSKSPRFTLNVTLFKRLPLHPQVNDIVGDFTSLILLEVDLSAQAQETFLARALRLQKQLWDDLHHRYVSGIQVLKELAQTQGDGTKVAMPIVFTSLLTHQTQREEAFPWDWLGETIYSITQTPQVWLDHQVSEEAGALVFNWDAVEELFPEGVLDEMFDTYCRLLLRLADEEEVWQETTLNLVPRAQLEQREAMNATDAPIPDGLLHTLFAAQVQKRPHQTAVVSANRHLSYEELYCCANQVGHRLRQLGAQPNTLVAVVMEKGWEQVVAVLGALTSGAAYLPIDPQLPQERLCYLLEHGEVKLALTQSGLDETVAWPLNVQRLCVDAHNGDHLVGVDDQPLLPVQGPEDLAYVIYTSGSTGLPKGVTISHRGAVNTILDINQRFGVGPEDRVLALSSLSFDLSVYDIFGTLAAGGTIIIPDALATRDAAHWAELMVQEQVTVWNSVPALMQMLVAYAADRPEVVPRSLRLVLLSGDWIPVSLPTQIKSLVEGVQTISLGGATEASIWSISYPIETVDPTWKSIPYGRPMKNQRFYVLNEVLAPCPVWVPGQLYIGGIGLAKGYWRDSEKTDANFITHPRTGERLYRTGDLGRYLPDGVIEFLGREDFQVKLHGYRIELGEIEAALRPHPGVREAVVTAVDDPRGNKRLVGYVVPKQENAPAFFEREHGDPSELSIWESLVEVDRRALPAPGMIRPEMEAAFRAPRTPVEEAVAAIWGQILGVERVGIHDNFFELGGDSLLAIQVMSRLREAFQVELPLRSLFEVSTVADLAESIETIRWATQDPQDAAIARDSNHEEGEL